MIRRPHELGASVQARLRNLAMQRQDDVQLVLTHFVLERLLHRLAGSTYGRQFVLKGAMLFAVWTQAAHRATRDLDLLGIGAPDPERIAAIFRRVCDVAVVPDGVAFDADSVAVARIREDQRYEGIRVALVARLGTARVDVQVDVGFGDAVHPAPSEIRFPSLLDHPDTSMLAYPREAVVAEKFEAMVSLGVLNSRMKDFYDLFVLAARFPFEGSTLIEAIRVTFARRQTDIDTGVPVPLSDEFAESVTKQAQWSAFVRRTRLAEPDLKLTSVIAALRRFLLPVFRAVGSEAPVLGSWSADDGWSGPASS